MNGAGDLGPLNLRCFSHPELVEPVGDLVSGVLAAKACHPDWVVTAGIVGIPPSGRHQCNLEDLTDDDLQCLLDLPEMEQAIDNSAEGKGERLVPSCDEAGLGEAFPPRRILEFLRGVEAAGGAAVAGSLCETDLSGPLQRLASEVQARIPR